MTAAGVPVKHPIVEESDSRGYLGRLTRLVRTLLGLRFNGASDLWQLQTDLLKLQRDIQRSIGDAKRTARQSDHARKELETLRNLRSNARRFGDAFAWLMLGLDRQIIYPLADNARVAIPSDDHGSRGAMAIATVLAGADSGFPILHDITDCLRIGDITFVKRGHDPTTVEVKTRVVDERPADGGGVTVEYSVTAISLSEMPPLTEVARGDNSSKAMASPWPRSNPRMDRQLRRLGSARAYQTAKPDIVNTIDGEAVISTHLDHAHAGHSDALRRVARKARRQGFATEAIDGAFLSAAIYDPQGVDPTRLSGALDNLSSDLISSGILFTENPERNSLVIYSIPTHDSGGPQRYLPYFLYNLPQTTIVDIVYGRMILLNLVNSGRVVEALEHAGFTVTLQTGRNDLSDDSLVLSAEFHDDSGASYQAEFHNLSLHINEMIMEFKSLQYVVDVAEAMRASTRLGILEREVTAPSETTDI